MAGDLTLQVLLDAALSGYLKELEIRPFERKSMLKLNMALQWYYDSKVRSHVTNELLVGLANQVSMAIGNRDAYSGAVKTVHKILDGHEYLLFRGSKEKTNKMDTSWQASLARFWEACYGMSLAEANRRGL